MYSLATVDIPHHDGVIKGAGDKLGTGGVE